MPADRPIRNALLIMNPGSRIGRRALPKAQRAFEKAGVRCDTRVTESPGHGATIAAELASRYDAVFTLGGDGTAMEVLGALAHSGPPVGILAGGTGNIVARTLGIPLRAGRAVQALLDGDEARIDLGRLASGQRFAVGMGVGLDASMIAGAPAPLKRRLGFVAYVVSATRAVLKLETFHVRLTVDDKVYESSAAAVLIANFGAVLNDLIAFGDGIRRDDGLLNACVYAPKNFRDAMRIFWMMSRKKFPADPSITYYSGKHFILETVPPRLGQADGELLGNSPFEIYVEPLAGRVLVPKGNRE
ncbi:MAG TPA: diacylglycerol kinase family protein [Gemmatimonadaceae bacterium]|jgi:diacylglycerol kinase (ATP)|nr:diacylglycerol kinase family protein [Gemmatimonadaceae bacterium]